MEPNSQQSLEDLIHRELTKLPERTAPDTLMPRVLAQIRARERRPWWQRAWPSWPLAAQLASMPLLLAAAAFTVYGLSVIWQFAQGATEFGSVWETLESVSSVFDILGVLGNAVLVLGRSFGPQWLLLALLVPVGLYLTCVGLGTLCYRMASYRR